MTTLSPTAEGGTFQNLNNCRFTHDLYLLHTLVSEGLEQKSRWIQDGGAMEVAHREFWVWMMGEQLQTGAQLALW